MEIIGAGLKVVYGDAAACCTPCVSNNNQIFTQTQVEQVRKIIRPYLKAGLLRDFGFQGKGNKVLGADYTAQDKVAFSLVKNPPGHACGIFDVRQNGYVLNHSIVPDFDQALKSLQGFLEASFPRCCPAISLVNG